MVLSDYCSELFKNKIFPAFCLKLKTADAASTYMLSVNMICDYLKKDYLDIAAAEAQDFFDALASGEGTKSGRPIAKNTIMMRFSCIRSISSFILANQDLFGIEYTSPFLYLNVTEPAQAISPDQVLTSEQIDNLLKCAKDNQMYLMISLVLTCGLAVKELITLKQSQLVLDEKNRLSISFLKDNGTDYRYIKVPESLKEPLLLHADSMRPFSDLVFTNKYGKPYSMRVIQLHVKELMEEAGMSGWTLQDLRKTASFYMLSGGASLSQTATQLGISERWMYRFNRVVEEMDVQAGDYNMIQIRGRKAD